MPTVFIGDLLAQGVRLDAREAVAIAQQLIAQLTGAVDLTSHTDAPLLGPPTPANVLLEPDGSVVCLGCQVKPAVFEMAVLLQTLLPSGTGQVPGGLRYAIARGLLDVDAPPFDSVEEFSRALARFERGDRAAVVRGVVARAAGRTPVHAFGRPRAVTSRSIERRRSAPSATMLRRELHEVDRRLYEERSALPRLELVPASATPAVVIGKAEKPGRRHLPATAALLVGGITLAGVADLVQLRRDRGRERSAAVAPPVSGVSGGSAIVAPHASGTPKGVPYTSGTATPHINGDAPYTSRGALRVRGAGTRERLRYAKTAQPIAEEEGVLVRALDDQQRPVFSPAFASSGTAMFFHTGGTRDAHSALAMATSPESRGDLGVMTIVDDGARNYHVQPSPDGRFIAFDSDRDGERGVYVARRDGANVRRISGAGYAAVPTWAPDGRRVTYVRAEADNPKVWNLWLHGLDEGQARRLTSYRYGQPWSASWFPDNRRVSYTHEDKLVILDVETGNAREFGSPMKGRVVRTPAVSPDGTKVIFQVYRQGAWILDLADGSMTCVLTDPTAEEFAWSPDGRRVAFHSRRDGQWGIYILHRS